MPTLQQGQRIVVKADRDEGRPREVGIIHHFRAIGTVVVFIRPEDRALDAIEDDGMREVSLNQIAEYRPRKMTGKEKRAKHTARLFKQGWRMFRIGHDRGHIVQLFTIDLDAGTASGLGLRGRSRTAALHDLYPMPLSEK
jgi:hypothetical protein